MSIYREQDLKDMTAHEIINHLFYLGEISERQASYEMDEFYQEVSSTRSELMNRIR